MFFLCKERTKEILKKIKHLLTGMRVTGQQVLLVETLKASLLTFFSKKVREKGVSGKVQTPQGPASPRPPLSAAK